jgi:hypothetical protein
VRCQKQTIFFHFREGNGLTIITRGTNQIWLEVKAENKKFTKSFFVLATSKNVLSKCDEFKPSKYGKFGLFSQKKPFYLSH